MAWPAGDTPPPGTRDPGPARPGRGSGARGGGRVAVFLAYPTYPAYDSLYSLLWAQELLDGARPGFDGYRAPTEHPLLLPVGLVLAPFGDAGARLFIALCFAGLVALVAADVPARAARRRAPVAGSWPPRCC